jgi:murein L,D-transpeptidase YcbB/YkuD
MDSATYKKLQLSPDSVRQLIGLNLERMRWMNQSPGTDYIIVPIPLMELFLVHKDEPGMHMRVVVGKPSRQTPSLNANMANVVLNPPWGVPPTILKKDVAPGLAKSGGAYLARKGLRAFDAKGKVINAGQINANNYRRYFYRQEPGARNALGAVKFNLPNKWDIYLHDTPHKEDFPNRNRAKSSGCIRVARPKDMAEYILSEMEGKTRFSPEYIDSVINTRKTRYELLQHKIPVHIVYLTAYADSNAQALRLLDDVYGHDSRMLARSGTIAKKY